MSRDVHQEVASGLQPQDETIEKGSPRSVNGLCHVDKFESWPFGPKLKSASTTHRSGGGPGLIQVEESPLTLRTNGTTQSEPPVNNDPDVNPPDTHLATHVPSSAPRYVPPKELDLSLQDRVECETGQGSELSEMKEKILAQTKTISDLTWRLQEANFVTTNLRETNKRYLRSVARVSQVCKTVTNASVDQEIAMKAKEKQLQHLEAEFNQAKVESAKAALSKELDLSNANDEMARLREQLAAQPEGDNDKELTSLKNEVQAFKDQLVSFKKSAVVVPHWVHTSLFDAAPALLAENVFFDAEAKKKEIEKRRSRKQTFGRRLAHIRRERGQHPHREVYRHSPKPCEIYRDATICLTEEPTGSIPAKRRELQDLGPGEVLEEDTRGGKGEEKDPMGLEEMMGIPRNAIPCLVEGQLAYREGTRVSPPPCRRRLLRPLLIEGRVGCQGSPSATESHVQGWAQCC